MKVHLVNPGIEILPATARNIILLGCKQGYKGIRKWPINLFTSLILNTHLNEPTDQNSK